jgi:hypothetical protein
MYNPHQEQARRAYEAQERREATSRFWNRQAFTLIYILCVIFVVPGVLIGGFALYLAIYEPEQFQRAIKSRPQERVDALDSPTYFVREEALRKLVRSTPDRTRRDVAEKIKKLLSDSNPVVQELAINSLGDWGQPEDAAPLVALAREPTSTFIRPKICVALGKLQGEIALAGLIDISGMGWSERDFSLKEFANFGPQVEPALLARGETADDNLKPAICAALQSFGTSASLPFLEGVAENKDPQVAGPARRAIAAIGERAK